MNNSMERESVLQKPFHPLRLHIGISIHCSLVRSIDHTLLLITRKEAFKLFVNSTFSTFSVIIFLNVNWIHTLIKIAGYFSVKWTSSSSSKNESTHSQWIEFSVFIWIKLNRAHSRPHSHSSEKETIHSNFECALLHLFMSYCSSCYFLFSVVCSMCVFILLNYIHLNIMGMVMFAIVRAHSTHSTTEMLLITRYLFSFPHRISVNQVDLNWMITIPFV